MDVPECPHCLLLLCDPVTVSCGHTFCRRCVEGYLPSKCPLCKERFKQREVRGTKNNVLLIGVTEKCHPEETRVRCQIQDKLKASEFVEALRAANEGLRLGKPLLHSYLTNKGRNTSFTFSTQSCIYSLKLRYGSDGCRFVHPREITSKSVNSVMLLFLCNALKLLTLQSMKSNI